MDEVAAMSRMEESMYIYAWFKIRKVCCKTWEENMEAIENVELDIDVMGFD